MSASRRRDLLLVHQDRTRLLRLAPGQAQIVGRSPEAQFFLNAVSVSRKHCALLLNEGKVFVEDLGSRNKVFVNDQAITRAELTDGCRLQIGKIPFLVKFLEGAFHLCPKCGAETPESLRDASGSLSCQSCWSVMDRGEPARAAIEREGYKVLEQLGRDPAVFKVEREDLGRIYRIEALPLQGNRDPKRVNDFIDEARLAASLSHPNIVRVVDIRRTPQLVYVVMDYDRSESLAERVQRRGPLSTEVVLHVLEELIAALEYAADRKVIHGNINPKNILLSEGGAPRITDFSLARQMRGAADTFDLDASGIHQSLMAPEVYKSQTGQSLDSRTDIFGLGLVLHFALTGRDAFGGLSGLQVALKARSDEPPSPDLTGVPAGFGPLICRMLAIEPAARHSNLAMLREDLRALGGDDKSDSGDALFSGAFSGDELIEFAQMIELHGKTGVLTVRGEPSPRGTVQFKDGRITDATGLPDKFAAARALLGARAGRFSFTAQDPAKLQPGGANIHVSALLMDIARQRDEAGR
jgi:tRNA A-37 threonylcarbamoyl transferase component Bud32